MSRSVSVSASRHHIESNVSRRCNCNSIRFSITFPELLVSVSRFMWTLFFYLCLLIFASFAIHLIAWWWFNQMPFDSCTIQLLSNVIGFFLGFFLLPLSRACGAVWVFALQKSLFDCCVVADGNWCVDSIVEFNKAAGKQYAPSKNINFFFVRILKSKFKPTNQPLKMV